jgi:hypothetical protein
VTGMGVRYSKTPLTYCMPAVCQGEHNHYVHSELLGMTEEEMSQLEEEKYIGDEFLLGLP